MKRIINTLIMVFTICMSTQAMSYEQARREALFLTDKMAYELNLTDSQYDAAYEINLDYLMGVTGRDNVYGTYWDRRNLDFSYILLDWQYSAFCAASYFYRPLYWDAGYWHFGIYARYPHRTHFYFSRPTVYVSYRGGHSWHSNGGRSFWRNQRHTFNHGGTHVGMRDNHRFNNNRPNNHGGYDRNHNGNRYDRNNNGNRFDRNNNGNRYDRNNHGGSDRNNNDRFDRNNNDRRNDRYDRNNSSTRVTVNDNNLNHISSGSHGSFGGVRNSNGSINSNNRSSFSGTRSNTSNRSTFSGTRSTSSGNSSFSSRSTNSSSRSSSSFNSGSSRSSVSHGSNGGSRSNGSNNGGGRFGGGRR